MAVPGTTGKILLVDLGTRQLSIETPSDDVYLKYLGGYGLGAYYLYKLQKPGADPLGPDNVLAFFNGLLTGTSGITSNRYVVVAKSPKTGTWGDANSGGDFGPAMKAAGFDVIMVDSTHPKAVDSWILYTREFYDLVRDRLKDEGIAVQWLPLHGLSEKEFKIIVKTFYDVFPHATLWTNVGFEVYGQAASTSLTNRHPPKLFL